ncbi:hypothetical protein PG985_013125 [Apiospora marii]|uniref:uncharacterized protein n=1 Tax=Apiospora marii TaxID=335849 RepID=UPI0031321F94
MCSFTVPEVHQIYPIGPGTSAITGHLWYQASVARQLGIDRQAPQNNVNGVLQAEGDLRLAGTGADIVEDGVQCVKDSWMAPPQHPILVDDLVRPADLIHNGFR